MIKITSVEIDGFITPSQKVKLDFVESNIVCIYGDNGSGKTSFLEILFAVFDRDNDILERYNVSNLSIEYILDDYEIRKQIKELEEELENFEFRDDIKKYRKEINFLDNKLKESNEDEIDYIREKIRGLEERINEEKYRYISEIEKLEKEISIKKIIIFKTECENEKGELYDSYNFDSLDNSEFNNISSLFLGIGRGIHKKELKIPKGMLWHFFRTHKKISEDKILTGNEIDDFSDKLFEYLMPKSKNDVSSVEAYKVKELDDKKNIYLPNIEIDIIEALLNAKYKEAVLDAKDRIEKSVAKTSLNFLKDTNEQKIDFQELKEKLLYNKLLLLEMFASDDNMGIAPLFKSLEKNENFLEEIEFFQQRVLLDIIKELQSEVELFKEIQVFIDEYNSFLNYDKRLVINSNGIFVSPENHSIEKLSSGERHLLTFLATILLMGEEQDFILLDEPEISLDVGWIEKLFITVSKLAPNSQIIIATHNLTILGDYFDESTEMRFEREQNG